MNKVLIFGSSGLLGNALFKYLKNQGLSVLGFDKTPKMPKEYKEEFLDVSDYGNVSDLVKDTSPSWLVNCVADVRKSSDNTRDYFYLNSVFPHLLSYYSSKYNCRLIHFSTNGVFNGSKGSSYEDIDKPDAEDMYGVSKILSESVDGIVIRTSIIGHSLGRTDNLLDWFLSNKEDTVTGYGKVYWNGVTTLTLAKVVERIIMKNLSLPKTPINLVADPKLSKYELLEMFNEVFECGKTVEKKDKPVEDRTLVKSPVQDVYFRDLVSPIREELEELKIFYELP